MTRQSVQGSLPVIFYYVKNIKSAKMMDSKMKQMGLNMEHFTIEGRTHNDANGTGVNELGEEIIKSSTI